MKICTNGIGHITNMAAYKSVAAGITGKTGGLIVSVARHLLFVSQHI